MALMAKFLFSAIWSVLLSLISAEIVIVDKSESLLFASQCSVPNENARFDCMPDNKKESDCKARGCCWDSGAASDVVEWQEFKAGNITRVKKVYTVPKCYFPTSYDGYSVVDATETFFGVTVLLKRTTFTSWPKDVMNLQLDVYLETATRVHFKIFDPAVARYEVPVEFAKMSGEKVSTADYTVTILKSPFGIAITRTSTGAILFDSTVAPLLFADQFIQISTHTGTGLVYGLGDHKGPLLLKPVWGQYAFWNSDHKMPLQTNLYGTQPFFLSLEKDGSAHGVLLVNSNAMEAITQPLPALTFRTIGGILDFYVFTGPAPNTVIQQYTDLIGRPFLPPYWALGYHLCRWGYRTEAELLGIIKRNLALEIPYEVQWNDIDYAVNRMDWTLNNDTYSHLPNIVHELHNIGMKYMMIVDVAIAAKPPIKYAPFDEGIQDGVFIRNASGQPLIGKVWPGPTVFPDWTHPKAADWWYRQAKRYHDIVPYDGIWADMNEPSNFVAGSIDGCTNNTLDVPPYLPDLIEGALPEETICPSGQHQLTSHYNLHNTYGHLELIATNKALKRILGKRSIIISRSTFISSGHWAGHWTGDNEASYDDLYYSIPAILSYNMFGIPLVGADICGFLKNTVEQLCVRWHQLGAFYPFMRNHNDPNNIPQDPGAFSPHAQQIIKMALELRYSLLPYLYTLFVRSHQTGATVARPLFFEFVSDEKTYDIDKQFLWGSALLISPALQKDQTAVDAYLPQGVWYDIYNGTGIHSNGSVFRLDSPLEKINVHARGGHIIPLQQPAVTTTRARKNPFQLLVALDPRSKTAEGELIWDDGDSLNSTELNLFSEISFKANTLVMTSTIVNAGYAGETGIMLEGVWVLGLHKNESFHVLVNDQKVPFDYNADNQELYIRDFLVDLLQPLTIRW